MTTPHPDGPAELGKPYLPPTPPDEDERLAALRDMQVLDTPADERFDRLTRLAAEFFEVPIALVSLVDEQRQWFKSVCGLGMRETPREQSFCAHALHEPDLLMVEDTRCDPRFAQHPLVVGEPHLRFYAGALIRDPEGRALGTLCIADRRSRRLDEREQSTLRRLAGLAEAELTREAELNRRFRNLARESLFDAHTGLALGELFRHRLERRLAGGAQAFRIILATTCEDPESPTPAGERNNLRRALAERLARFATGEDIIGTTGDGILLLARADSDGAAGLAERLHAALGESVTLAAGDYRPILVVEQADTAVEGGVGTALDRGLAALTRRLDERRRALERARVEQEAGRITAQLRQQVSERTRALEEFLQAVTHDLREPLNQMDTYAALIEAEGTGQFSGQAREDLRSIREAAGRMAELIDALRELARVGREPLSVTSVDIAECVGEVLADLAGSVEEAGARIDGPPKVSVRADRALLRAVYQNLLANALNHAGPRPGVRFTHERESAGDVLGVADDGHGIAREERERVFRPFQRLATGASGSGLGLTLVERIVERHGGRVWIEAGPDGGTHVRWLLPDTLRESAP